MAIEFASQDRTVGQVDERFSNIGGMYQQARASRQARPFGPVPRDHGKRIEEARKTETEAEALIRKVKVGALLKRPVTETGRPRTTKAGRRFDLAAKYRQAGNVTEAERQERLASETARGEWVSHLAHKTIRKLRSPATRFSDNSEV
jgi:hypothetical protein